MAFYGYVNTMRCAATDVDAFTATGINTSNDIQNGYFVTLGDYQLSSAGAVTEFVYDVTLAAASTLDNWLVRTPEVGTDILTQMLADPRYFINVKGQPMQLVKPIKGDVIEVTVDTIDQAAAKGDYYTLVAGKLTKGSATTDATCFVCLGTHSINFGGTDVTTYLFRCTAN